MPKKMLFDLSEFTFGDEGFEVTTFADIVDENQIAVPGQEVQFYVDGVPYPHGADPEQTQIDGRARRKLSRLSIGNHIFEAVGRAGLHQRKEKAIKPSLSLERTEPVVADGSAETKVTAYASMQNLPVANLPIQLFFQGDPLGSPKPTAEDGRSTWMFSRQLSRGNYEFVARIEGTTIRARVLAL